MEVSGSPRSGNRGLRRGGRAEDQRGTKCFDITKNEPWRGGRATELGAQWDLRRLHLRVHSVKMGPAAIGSFQIVRELGRGGMGEVYLARDTRLERMVAVKALPAHLASDADRLARFEREAKALASLNHPGIGAIYGMEEADGHLYLILEYIDGETLADRLARKSMPVVEAMGIARQIAEAIGVAHGKGVVHRDLKPGNVMLTPDGTAKVVDFGLALTADGESAGVAAAPGSDSKAPTLEIAPRSPTPTIPGAIMGSAGYMSPEQSRGKPVDSRSDVFSFGCVLYEMLTGAMPFRGDTLAESIGATLHKELDFSRLPADTPARARTLLQRCLEKDPLQRFQSAAQVADALAAMQRWAREEAIPELARMCDRILVLEEGRDSWTAFELACEIDKLAPGDLIVERLRPDFSNAISITSEPAGARVFGAYYGDPEGEERDLGETPLTNIPFPRGLSRVRLELSGHRPAHDLIWSLSRTLTNASDQENCRWHYALRRPDEVPAEMEEIPAGGDPMFLPGLDHMPTESIAAFLMDRHPVTNREYKRFLDDGGYSREEFWREPFMAGERTIDRREAMSLLVDAVGQPGPAGWEMGEYPAGEADHPVSGVCWYEASAFAAWIGKSLPTVFHWSRVAMTQSSAQIVPAANFSGRRTLAVGSTRSFNRFGVRDLAGNVREWIVNPIDRAGQRFILGGGWNDPGYAFVDAYAQAAFDRSPSNGFRCIRAKEQEPNEAALTRQITVPFRDFRAEKPVPDEVFAYFRRQFHYDPVPLNATPIADRASPAGRWQTTEINTGYGAERMQVHLFLPERAKPPYQTVVLFPGSLALNTRLFNLNEARRVDFLVKSGRALVLPVYKGTFERGDGIQSDYPRETAFYKDHVVMWSKDLARAIDFVESRDDLDSTRIAYYGVSWGGALGAILPAIESRIRVNILYVAGLNFQRSLPEADQLNYVTRVTQPTLMLNGELDFYFPLEHSQRPMFELLGTPPEHKKQLTYARGHTVPKTEMIRESLAWLDRYFGPVGEG